MLGLTGMLATLSACGNLDYSMDRHNLNPQTAQGDQLAALRVNYDETSNTYDIPVKRIGGGYAVQAPIYHDDDGSTTARMEVSKTNDFHWFFGPRLSLSF